tara:strand:- start:3 stop:503 length:501 start_codon:yes stop_codon:yes gene_type:complete
MSDLYCCKTEINEDEFFYERDNSTFFVFQQPNSRRLPYCNLNLVQAQVNFLPSSSSTEKTILLRCGVDGSNYFCNDNKRLPIMGLLNNTHGNTTKNFRTDYEANFPVRTSSNFTTIEIILEDELGDIIPTSEILSIHALFRVDYLQEDELRDDILETKLSVNKRLL